MTFQTVESQISLDSIYQPVQYIESKSHPGKIHEVRCLLNSGVWTCSNCPAFDKLLTNPDVNDKRCQHIKDAQKQIYIKSDAFPLELPDLKMCNVCFSTEFKDSGFRKLANGTKRRRHTCKKCGHRQSSFEKGFRKMKNTPQNIIEALDLTLKGVSYRDVSTHLSTTKNLRITQTSIKNWETSYRELISAAVRDIVPPKLGVVWSVDETVIRIKNTKIMKKGFYSWLWIIVDVKTRYIIATVISKRRDISNAMKLLAKAKKISGITPHYIITDCLSAYKKAIIRVFGLEKVAHIQTKSIAKGFQNRCVERVNNEFKDITKRKRGLGNDKSAQAFVDTYVDYHNFIRPHTGLPNNQTPAEYGGSPLNLGKNKIKSLIEKASEPEYNFAIQLGKRIDLVNIKNEGDCHRVIPKGWIDKKVWREINDILRLNKFSWLNDGKENGCWIRLKKQTSLMEFCN